MYSHYDVIDEYDEDIIYEMEFEVIHKYYIKHNYHNIIKDFEFFCAQNNLLKAQYLHKINPLVLYSNAFNITCNNGNYEIFKWLINLYENPINDKLFNDMCIKGYYLIVKYIYLNYKEHAIVTNQLFEMVCCSGNYKMVKFLYGIQKIQITNELFNKICVKGYYYIVEFMLKNNKDIIISNIVFNKVCYGGYLKTLKILMYYNKNLHMFRDTIDKVAYGLHLKTLKWLLIISPQSVRYLNIYLVLNELLKSNHMRFNKKKCCKMYCYLLSLNNGMIYSDEYAFLLTCKFNNYYGMRKLIKKNPLLNISFNDDYAFKTACEYNFVKIALFLSNLNSFEYRIYNKEKMSKFSWNTISYKIVKNINIRKNIKLEQNEKCYICYDDKSDVYTLCKHFYCKYCIIEWLDISNKCPYCREILNVNKLYLII